MDRDKDYMSWPETSDAQIATRRARTNFRFELVLRTYAAFGLLISFGAMAYFFLTTLEIEFTSVQMMSLLIAGTSFALAVLSMLMLAFRRQKDAYEHETVREYLKNAELIDYWGQFENIGRTILSREGEDFNKYSPRSIIQELKKEGRLSDQDLRTLQAALELRNGIVHGRAHFSPDAVSRVSSALREIVTKLADDAPLRF